MPTCTPDGPDAPGERHRLNGGVGNQRTHVLYVQKEVLEDAVGESRLSEHLLARQRAPRNAGRVLQQDGIPRHDRRRGRPKNLPEREVPRHDGQDRPQRAVAPVGLGRTLDLHGAVRKEVRTVVGVVVAHPSGLFRLGDPLSERFAHLFGHESTPLRRTIAQDRTDAPEDFGPLPVGRFPPTQEGVM